MGERKVGLIPRVMIQGALGPKEYGLLITDKRTIFVLEHSSKATIGGILGGAVGATLTSINESRAQVDYIEADPNVLSANKKNTTINHTSIQKLVLKKGLSGYTLRITYSVGTEIKKIEATLILPEELIRQKKAEGISGKDAIRDYAEKAGKVFEQAFPPEISQRVEWRM